MSDIFARIHQQIVEDPANASMKDLGYAPLYTAGAGAKIVVIGQAPGRKAQESMKPWSDASGETLRRWMGVDAEQFYDPETVSLLPMDFYFPGKGKSGDLPPRKGFAEKWHTLLLAEMPRVELTLVIGAYAQKHYLKGSSGSHDALSQAPAVKRNLTETVRSFADYLPGYFPLVHPSPLNFRWIAKNPWFEESVVPALQSRIAQIL